MFDFLHHLMLGEVGTAENDRAAALHCAMGLQQYTGPVMAKALEDTAFYRHPAYLTLNEVGGNPEQFHTTPAMFHRANLQRGPRAMITLSTHDSKRGADAHARLAVLSERAEEWTRQVTAWSRVLRARRGDVEGHAPPDRRDEYALYQNLVATWPPELLDDPAPEALDVYKDRVTAVMIKSVREAKVFSTWANPDAAYEDAIASFIADALDPARGDGFMQPFLAFTRHIAALGARNTLAQMVLTLCAPGLPDLYQGRELWDLFMVDPDNRQPVDYAGHERLLADTSDPPARYLDTWRDGRFKLAATAALLRHRARHPALFLEGDYVELPVEGVDAERVCAFMRRHDSDWIIVAVTRFPSRGAGTATLCLPPELEGLQAREMMSGEGLRMTPKTTLAEKPGAAGCVVLTPAV